MIDPVKAPIHYRGDGKVECKRALKSMMHKLRLPSETSYWWGCAFKYIWRWPHKNGVQDIDKAIECLTELRKAVSEEE